MKEPIGLKDHHGTEIREGDIVEFWFTGDTRQSSPTPVEGWTRMVDTVKLVEGQWAFWDEDINCGAYAWRFNKVCTIIGNIHETAVVS